MADNRDTGMDIDDLADEALDRNDCAKIRMCCSCTNRTNDLAS